MVNLLKIDPHCQQQKCSAWNLVSGDIRFMRIFAAVSLVWGRGVRTPSAGKGVRVKRKKAMKNFCRDRGPMTTD